MSVQSDEPHRPSLNVSAVQARLAGSPWRVEVVEESPSTNAAVAERARAGEPAGLVVVAEHQSAGRGRLGRSWVTPPRTALTVSLLVEPDAVPVERWPWLPLLTGLAAVDAVRRTTGLAVTLKWPNDVLVGDRKLAGILTQRIERRDGAVAVVGVGLNVSSAHEDLPVPTATSLALEGRPDVDRGDLLVSLLESFTQWYDGWMAAEGRGIHESYVAVCSTLGRDVRVDLPDGTSLSGVADGVDQAGRLLVDDGRRVHSLGAGDVVHVRSAGSPA
ncbi:MAG TPA: biotin--[acetyl-CoA-carboxylase] ligase [Nocardioidaceae bacterium]|nr:biotin--[acetyl-CoA-carboxylase] ligase [Nocardioidaceae bacterium]